MLFYHLDILLLSKDIKDSGILFIFFQKMLSVVFDEFDYYDEGLIFFLIIRTTPKVVGCAYILVGGLLARTSPQHHCFNLY